MLIDLGRGPLDFRAIEIVTALDEVAVDLPLGSRGFRIKIREGVVTTHVHFSNIKGEVAKTDRVFTPIGAATFLPASPAVGDVAVYTAARTGQFLLVDVDGSTAVTSAAIGDIFVWDGTNWTKRDTMPLQPQYWTIDGTANVAGSADFIGLRVMSADAEDEQGNTLPTQPDGTILEQRIYITSDTDDTTIEIVIIPGF